MDSMKSFTTAAKAAETEGTDEEGILVFDIDGFPVTAYRPQDGQIAVLMADFGRHASRQQMIGGAINFFHSTLDEGAAAHIEQRLLDRKDPYGLAEVQEVMEWMIEEWTGVPFGSASGSTPSQPRTGQRSKPSTRKSA